MAIGNLERFAADWERENREDAASKPVSVNGKKKGKVAVVGSGPAGLTAAAELNRLGYGGPSLAPTHRRYWLRNPGLGCQKTF